MGATMAKPIKAVVVGKWSVGLHNPTGSTILTFEFTDRKPMTFLLDQMTANDIAQAIVAQSAKSVSPPLN